MKNEKMIVVIENGKMIRYGFENGKMFRGNIGKDSARFEVGVSTAKYYEAGMEDIKKVSPNAEFYTSAGW